jgi:hypothetical protein
MPIYARLNPIINFVDAPTAVALDSYGNVYLTESSNNRLLIYSQSGQHQTSLIGLNKPISVTVDNSGRIYIGNKDSGNVEVYSADLSLLFKLYTGDGSGDGEFIQPNDIAIDSTGKIYVVDKGAEIVKIYNTDGSYFNSFGTPGGSDAPTPDGHFHKPSSIEIDEAAGEIIVLDRKLIYDRYGNPIDGARIQKFYMDGSFKSSFDRFGFDIGYMRKPQHVAVDSESRLYITDSDLAKNELHVYEGDGTYLGSVNDETYPLRSPLGIALGTDNKLYIASLFSGRVEIYGIIPYTNMEVSPLYINFEWQRGGEEPSPQSVEIINNGSETLNWTANTNDIWITLSDTSGSAAPSASSALDVGVILDGLTAGTVQEK